MIDKIIQKSQENQIDTEELLETKSGKELLLFAYYYLYRTLPTTISQEAIKNAIAKKLIELEDEEFLRLAYRLILRRDIDEDGKRHFMDRLKYQLKESILDAISSSKEAKQKDGIRFRLSPLKKLWYKLLSKVFPPEYRAILTRQRQLLSDMESRQSRLVQDLQAKISLLQNQIESLKTPIELQDTYLEECSYLQHAKNECKRLFGQECHDYYILFENIFYNSQAVIHLQQIYLPYIKGGKIVDIGCGRGEFLKLLQEKGYKATGIEINPELVKLLKQKGFDVVQADANTFLKEHCGLDTIVALEVIEHMDTAYLEEFLHLAYRALNEQGVIILETINPLANTGIGNFYMDITHKKPLPPKMMAFWLEFIGFKNIKILYSSPVPQEYRTSFMDKNYQTYAIIGEK